MGCKRIPLCITLEGNLNSKTCRFLTFKNKYYGGQKVRWIFFHFRINVHCEFLTPAQMINKKYYLSVRRHLREVIRLKGLAFWATTLGFCITAYISLVLRDHFAKNSTHIVLQPPYSPILAPCDFWLLQKLKTPLRGTRFESIEEITRKEVSFGKPKLIYPCSYNY